MQPFLILSHTSLLMNTWFIPCTWFKMEFHLPSHSFVPHCYTLHHVLVWNVGTVSTYAIPCHRVIYKILWMRIFECGTSSHLPFASRDGKSLVVKMVWLCGGIMWCGLDSSTQKSVHFGTVIYTWHGVVFIKCNSIFPVNWKGLNKKLSCPFLGTTPAFLYRYWGI